MPCGVLLQNFILGGFVLLRVRRSLPLRFLRIQLRWKPASFLWSRQAHRDHRHRRDRHHAQAGGRSVHTTARFYCARRLSDRICVPRSVEQMNQKTHKTKEGDGGVASVVGRRV